MDMLRQLKERYETYGQEAQTVAKEASPFAGVFGWGEDPKKDPCHMRFYEAVEQWVKDFLAAGPDSAQAYEAARWILAAPAGREGEPTFWFMYAAHGCCRELIPLLTPEGCAALGKLYDASFPRRDRLPVQKEIYRLLRARAARG